MATDTDRKCEDCAGVYIPLAGLTDDPEIRDRLIAVARSWRATAMARPHAQSPQPVAGDNDRRSV